MTSQVCQHLQGNFLQCVIETSAFHLSSLKMKSFTFLKVDFFLNKQFYFFFFIKHFDYSMLHPRRFHQLRTITCAWKKSYLPFHTEGFPTQYPAAWQSTQASLFQTTWLLTDSTTEPGKRQDR